MPKVSIILPVFDARRFLALALASLLEQSHRNIEVIAIDDGSRDGSLAILRAAAEMDPRVTVVSRPNRGLIATLNEGLQRADSDFVARMDADDISHPGRIAAQVAAFAEDNALGLLGTNFDTLFAPDRVEAARPATLTRVGERAIFGRFVTALRHPTVMFRRTRLGRAALAYDPAYPCAEDFDLFRRLAEETRIAETPDPWLTYRLHPASVSATQMAVMVRTHLAILDENLTRHYPGAGGIGLAPLADTITADGVDAAASLIRRLDALGSAQPDHERAAYETGVSTTFYFLYAHICRNGRFALARRFVDGAGRWQAIRRRERLLLAAADSLPVGSAFALFDQGEVLRRRMRAHPLADRVPEFAGLSETARRIESAAQIAPNRTAA